MSSIIYIEQNERNRLIKAWKEQIYNMEKKLNNLKNIASSIKDKELIEEIEIWIRNLKNEFEIVFKKANNDEIIKEFDVVYLDAKNVEDRLKEINKIINQIELKVKEKLIEKEILIKKINNLKHKISKHSFLSDLSKKFERIEDLNLNAQIEIVNKIEEEVNQKIDLNSYVKQTKTNLKETINEIKDEIKKYSFLEKFNIQLSKIEIELSEVGDLDISNLNKAIQKFENIKKQIEEKESKVLNSIEAIKNYVILKEEIIEIDNLINDLGLSGKSKHKREEKLKKTYSKYLEKLKYYSPTEAIRIEDLDISLENKLLELKITYQREKTKYLISKKLEEIKQRYENDEIFIEKFAAKIQNVIKSGEKKDLYKILYDIEKYENNKKILTEQINILKEKLKKLGYKFEDEIKLGEVGYIEGSDKEYKIKYVFHENGEIGFNFVRVGKLENLNLYEKNKTIEMAKKWCKNFDLLNEELKRDGIEFSISLREEPTIDEIIFEELEGTENYKEEGKVREGYIEESR